MSANSNKNDNHRADRNPHTIHSSAMTPSIITTINNTNPTPTAICNNGNSNNNNGNLNDKIKRPNEPYYESYIEDSFVGHWEREDDDSDNLYRGNSECDDGSGAEEDDSALHPSTIEFDFDSFGPESFIYAPLAVPSASGVATKTSPPLNQEEVDKDDSHFKTKDVQEEESRESVTPKNEEESAYVNNNVQEVELLDKKTEVLDKTTTNESTSIQKVNLTLPKEYNPLDYNLVETAQIDLKVIEPYKKVISHAGYCHHFDPSSPPPKPGESAPAVIVFSACYLPDRSRRDYNYVMDHLFLYVLSSLHELIADDYILVYLHNTQPSKSITKASTSNTFLNGSSISQTTNTSATTNSNEDPQQSQNNLPTFTWIKRCYQMIDRKLRKNLKILYLVKPTFWLKTIVIMCKPFISSKFSKKLRFIENMEALKKCLPVEELILPASAANI